MRSFGCLSGVFIVNFEYNFYIVSIFLMLTLNKLMPAGYCKNNFNTKFSAEDIIFAYSFDERT